MDDEQIRIGILTVSDRCYNGITRDASGELLESMLNDGLIKKAKVVIRMCVPDEYEQIKVVLLKWSDVDCLDLVLTTGGTGLAPRDITPEATQSIIEKEAFGISIALLFYSLKSTSFAMLSRPSCGIRKRTLIINFPGSSKACVECLNIVSNVIPHAINIIKDCKEKTDQVHMRQLTQDINNLRASDDCPTTQNHISKSEELSVSKVDINKVAHRHRVSPYPLITVQEAQKLIVEETSMQHRLRNIHINDALGYILYGDVIAEDAVPSFTASLKDGYAVIANDRLGKRRVSNSSILGNKPLIQAIKSGECVRVTTGAPIPPGADAVVQVEDTALVLADEEGTKEIEVEIKSLPKPGQDIRKIGSDIQEGETVLHRGTYLAAPELAVLASIGHTFVSVYEKPSIAILSTGNELIPPSETIEEGKVRDSNKIMLLGLLKENGFNATDAGIMPDEPNVMLTMLKKAMHKSEVIITTGSASMGERDILTDVLIKDLGAIVHFGRVNMKPGKPTKFLTLRFEEEHKYVFVLPGNPVSAFVTSHLFVLPALKSLSGHLKSLPKLIKAKIPLDIDLDERYEFQRGKLDWLGVDVIPTATPIDNQGSSRLLNTTGANCLIYLPSATNIKKLRSGNIINVQLIAALS